MLSNNIFVVLISLPPSLTSFPGPRFFFPRVLSIQLLDIETTPCSSKLVWPVKGRECILLRPMQHQVFENNFCFPFCTPGTALGEEVLNDLATASSSCDYLSILRCLIHMTSFLPVPAFGLRYLVWDLIQAQEQELCSRMLLATGYRDQKVNFPHVTGGEHHMKRCCQRGGAPEEDRTPPEQVRSCKT